MLITGTIVSYNTLTRTASVNITGWGIVTAQNVLPQNVEPSMSIANNFLERYETNTVMPAVNFQSPDIVGLVQDGSNWLLLGNIVSEAGTEPTTVGRPGPGAIDLSKTIATDTSGTYFWKELGERAWINQIKVTPAAGGTFTVKVYNSANQLQASWGDGSVALTGSLTDAAGFGFTSESRVGKFVLLPVGTYTVELLGERFA